MRLNHCDFPIVTHLNYILTPLLFITAWPKVNDLDVSWTSLRQKYVFLLRICKRMNEIKGGYTTKIHQMEPNPRLSLENSSLRHRIGPHQVLFKELRSLMFDIAKISSRFYHHDRINTGLRSQWIIFSLWSICRHRRRACVKRRMRAILKPWKLFFLMSSYKLTLKKEEQECIWFMVMHCKKCTTKNIWNLKTMKA